MNTDLLKNASLHFFNSFLQGGAAVAAINIFENVSPYFEGSTFFFKRNISRRPSKLTRRDGFEKVFVSKTNNHFQRITNSIKARCHHKILKKYQSGRPGGYEQFSYAKQFYKTPYSIFGDLPNIIHLNWIADWVDYSSFFSSIPNHVPIVWTLHDMNPFTGGCHYAWSCTKYRQDCQSCFQLGPYNDGNLSNISWKEKWEAIKDKNLHIVADSKWLEEEARSSRLFRNARSFQTIHYSVDLNIFKPKDKNAIRKKLEISDDQIVLVFGAASFANRRKGFETLIAALGMLEKKRNNLVCLIFGAGQPFSGPQLPEMRFMGKISSPEELVDVYNAGDVFVIPSLQEAFGLTALEAAACGTPAIGFKAGGIPDIIQHNVTGLLAETGEAADLANKLEAFFSLSPTGRERMGSSARNRAVEHFSKDVETRKYLALYRRILNA